MKSKPDHHEKNGTVRIYGIKNSFLTNCGFLIILLQIIPPDGMNIYEKDNELCERSEKNLTDRK